MTTMAIHHEAFPAVCQFHRLQQAWLELWSGRTWTARSHGAGLDGVTLAEWANNWPARLTALQAELRNGRYRPSPLLWFDIPRRDERNPDRLRRLGIPTVTDRVIQRAVKNVIEPFWESQFLSCSHGYRRDRSVFTAIAHVLWHEATGLRWVADADIEGCFDAIDHGLLLDQLAPLYDAPLIDLIAGWLDIGCAAPGLGVAQGAVLSPLLMNIYLHPFDVTLIQAGYALVRYADDFVVMSRDRREAEQALAESASVLAALRLALNPNKSQVVPLGPGYSFLGAQFEQ